MSSESLFCRDCGALLDVSRSSASKISCARCPYSVPLNQYCSSYTRVSSSRAKIDYNALCAPNHRPPLHLCNILSLPPLHLCNILAGTAS